MADIEKVIKGLEILMNGCEYIHCDDCCFYISTKPTRCGLREEQIQEDAIALLKEQETEWEHLWDAPDGTFKGRCKKCGFVHFFIEGHDTQYKFCPECGRSAK